MNTTYPIAAVGELIGDPARAAILIALLDGKARTVGELTLTAGVSAQSASAHLSKLVDGGLLTASRSGRHRYYAMAGPDVAHVLEALGSISTLPRARIAAVRPSAADDMYTARSCYNHLAGRIAVELSGALQKCASSALAVNATTNSAGPVALGSPISALTSTPYAASAGPTLQELSAPHSVPAS